MIRPCASCGFEFEGNGSFEYCPHCDRDGPPSIDLQAFRSLFGCHGYAPTHHGGPDEPGHDDRIARGNVRGGKVHHRDRGLSLVGGRDGAGQEDAGYREKQHASHCSHPTL